MTMPSIYIPTTKRQSSFPPPPPPKPPTLSYGDLRRASMPIGAPARIGKIADDMGAFIETWEARKARRAREREAGAPIAFNTTWRSRRAALPSPKRDKAERFLRQLLSRGPVKAKTVGRKTREAGITKATLQTVEQRIGVIKAPEGWSLPPET